MTPWPSMDATGPPWPDGIGHLMPGGLVLAILICVLVDYLKMLVELLGRERDRTFQSDTSRVSAIIACRDGARVLPATIAELARQIPPERIHVVDDGSLDHTAELALRAGCVVHRFRSSKGKVQAVHYALHRVRTPLVLLLDDDTRLGGTRLPTSLIEHDGFDAVAFDVLPDRRNREGAHGNNFLGHVQRYEYAKSMAIGRRFHDVAQSVSCVSGAAGLFRTSDLQRMHHRHSTVFPGEDFQRTLLHLLDGRRIVFADEPVWTVAPHDWRGWLRQRLLNWYPGLYHQIPNMLRLWIARGTPRRLRYEMAYNLWALLTDPFKVASIVVIALSPRLHAWGVALYLLYLSFELQAWWVIRAPGTKRRAPIGVLVFYPLYGAANTLLRAVSLFSFLVQRFVTGTMRPTRGPRDRRFA